MKMILIVEDVELNVELLFQLLEDDFYLLVANDGIEGVAMAKAYKPDLVLMDISLPNMDGYEATQNIHEIFPTMPVIGLSANAMQSDAQKALASGFNAYLTKPINEDLLFQKINECLG